MLCPSADRQLAVTLARAALSTYAGGMRAAVRLAVAGQTPCGSVELVDMLVDVSVQHLHATFGLCDAL
jgi:hypothetical protein